MGLVHESRKAQEPPRTTNEPLTLSTTAARARADHTRKKAIKQTSLIMRNTASENGWIIRSSWDGYTTLTASRISSQHQHRQTKQSAKSINIPSVTTSHISSHSHRRASIEYQRTKKSIKGATFEPSPKHAVKQQHKERKSVCVSHDPPPHFPDPPIHYIPIKHKTS